MPAKNAKAPSKASKPGASARTATAPVEPVKSAPVKAASPVPKAASPAAGQAASPKASAPRAADPVEKTMVAEPTPPATKAVAQTAAAVTEGTTTMINETKNIADKAQTEMKHTAEAVAERGQAMFAEVSDRSKNAMEKSTKAVEEMVDFAKGNMEALMVSSRVAAKGAEELTREAAEFGRQRIETATSTMKSFASAKSPTEVFQLQSDYAKGAFDSMIAETSKMSEAWLKLANEMFEPITTRYAAAAEKAKLVAA